MKLNPIKQKLYKVFIRNEIGHLRSANPHLDGQWVHVYDENSINRPARGRFFTFESFNLADSFASQWNRSRTEIWEVEGYGAKTCKTILNVNGVGAYGTTFWSGFAFARYFDTNKKNPKLSYLPLGHPPAKTVLVKSLKLVKLIKKGYNKI